MREPAKLRGSEAQSSWAAVIRDSVIMQVEAALRHLNGEPVSSDPWEQHQAEEMARLLTGQISPKPEVLDIYLGALTEQPEASWWIDRRDLPILRLLTDLRDQLISSRRPSAEERTLEAEAQAGATILPETRTTHLVAEVRTLVHSIEVRFPQKWDRFRDVMHQHDYEWNRQCWRREFYGITHGTATDRAAEIGHHLLAAGIPVRIYNNEIRQMAADSSYTPEPVRWVKRLNVGAHAGWFILSWPDNEDWRDRAMRLHKSKWERNTGVVVPPESVDEMLDFAETHQFTLSPGALRMVDEIQALRRNALTVAPVPATPGALPNEPPKLAVPSEVEIHDDLRDDV